MTTLEDLYYGNISPHERDRKRGTRADTLLEGRTVLAVNQPMNGRGGGYIIESDIDVVLG